MTPLLACENLSVVHRARPRRAEVEALVDVSLSILEGDALGIAGESGAGKSTLARVLCGLQAPTGGRVLLDGRPFDASATAKERRRIQIVFQDPGASLDPRLTVYESVVEGIAIHGLAPRAHRRDRCAAILERVGLKPELLERFPNELSGGQIQRVALARALAVEPEVVVCDEPTASLDRESSAGILNLLRELRRDGGLTVVLVSHDLAVIRAVASRVAVMYAGTVVEAAETADLYAEPIHPYTKALLGAAAGDRAWVDAGSGTGTNSQHQGGCPYVSRCEIAEAECAQRRPPLVELTGGRAVACPVNEKKSRETR